ncbi:MULTISPECIES: DUF3955 domain-containing protein [Romboutsia]|uniref:Prokaryotic membrane lipoprotein lipid attachment site profile n=1 Tax=Romboutsia hominis TaxID=1507512 RepID=A0A2P2BQ29_9FIRM|nr:MULTISPECIES: DUF3955 domain-containing protein [Romboutsia]MDB8792533.1 DUF3955 domain-containing protein [Romboutsia sp. 1001216sp1]MDB8795828.1 DUF3955 domain-containing protein [Romboutsia sp. 1001216sp1]MDB8798293.1 DUF3955 domain-containing protein [Romboutsia sp. 1001216sp1]MDB8803726.1 DUF3955 domain-containing protein [Romboutsia sp. 1001216sp1]MDB8806924.1 DUF3955 domain-containing protein [Romboutsia sp. 1001216sp1]
MKKYILNLIPFIISIGCFVSFNFIGSEVAPDGTLVEPFFLIPIGYLFLFIGIIGVLVRVGLNYFKRSKCNQ